LLHRRNFGTQGTSGGSREDSGSKGQGREESALHENNPFDD
jgi:hypothetical protein